MKVPVQSYPVNRKDIIEPDLTIGFYKDKKGNKRPAYHLVHGANSNPNSPMQFSDAVDYGCGIFSGASTSGCFARHSIF